MTHPIVIDNIGCLKDCLDVTSSIGQEAYLHRNPELFPHGTYGAHLRHVVEFYFCFLEGLGEGHIDYARRRRDLTVEESLDEGLKALEKVMTVLESISRKDLAKSVRVMSEHDLEVIWIDSCCLRELEYLIHHSVHHFALMSAQLRQLGKVVPNSFGVARSTLRHLASCAP